MVSLRKVGAIAASALLVGATFGAATAVSFSSSMLAQNGEAKAQLVVGANAPGKTADTASAQIIADKAKSDLAVSGAGGDLSIKYYVDDLDDDAAVNYGDNNFTHGLDVDNFVCCDKNNDNVGKMYSDSTGTPAPNTTAGSDMLWGVRGSLKYDENGDGDLQDAGDYLFYNGIYVVDYVSTLDFQPAYILGNVSAGSVIKINGDKYLITKKTLGNSEMDIGPAITKTLVPVSTVSIADAQTVSGDIKLQLVGTNAWTSTLYMISASSTDTLAISGNVDPYAAPIAQELTTVVHTASDVLDAYKVWLTNGTNTSLTLGLAESSQVVTLINDQTDVLGYNKIKIDDTAWGTKNTNETTRDALTVLLADPLSVAKDSDVDIPDTLFNMKYTLAGAMDLRRAKSTTATSGTKMKVSSSKYSPFLKSDITPTATGQDISIKYYVDDLDDDAAVNYGDNNFTHGLDVANFVCCDKDNDNVGKMYSDSTGTPAPNTTAGSDMLWGVRGSLKYDENGDGDLQDANDYLFYNGIYVVDYVSTLDFQPAYILGNISAGSVVKINGDSYLITKKTLGNSEMDIGPAITKTLAPTTTVSIADAQTVSGDIKLQLVATAGDQVNWGTLYIIDSSSTDTMALNATIPAGTVYPVDITTAVHDASDVLDGYKVFVRNVTGTTTLSMALAESSQVVTLINDQTDVLGYNKIKIDDTAWGTKNTNETTRDALTVLLADPLSVAKDSDVDIPDTIFNMKYTLAGAMDLRRAKSTTATSGTKMKVSSSKYSPFLTSDITPTVTGGEEKAPVLAVKAEDTADQTMNLVLVGGPVANTLVADLVTAGKSTTDWYASEGDIEVVSDAFTAGKYGVIVAGKNRDATKAAAEDLAAQIA